MNCSEYSAIGTNLALRTTHTPLPHPNPFAHSLFAPHWKWPHIASPHGHPRQAPLPTPSSTKKDILLWFQNLSAKDKIACTALHDPAFVAHFLAALPLQAPRKLFNLPQGKAILASQPAPDLAYFCELLSHLRVGCLEQPMLYFSTAEVIDLRMLEWLNKVSSNKIFEYAQRGREEEENLLWFNRSSFHHLQNWLASQLEISIIKNYFSKGHQHSLQEFTHFLTKRGKHAEAAALEMKLEVYAAKTHHELAYITAKIKEEEEKFNEFKQEKLIQNVEKVTQFKKRGRRRQKNKENEKKGPQETSEKGTPRAEVKGIEAGNYQECPKETITTHEEHHPSPVFSKQSPKITSPTKEESNECKQPPNPTPANTAKSPPKRKPSASKNLIYVSPKRTRSPEHIRSSSYLQDGDIKEKYSEQDRESSRIGEQSSQNNFSSEAREQRDTLNKRRRRKCKKESEHFRQARRAVWSRLITRQLDQMVEQINIETNSLYEFRVIAFERVRVFVQSLYPIANALLFGSNAIGLSLPNSDVDILLYELPCNVKEDARDFLAQIAVEINAMGWVVSCSTYLNAKVPIIKLQIDPSIPFLQTKRRQDLFRVYNPMALYYLDTDKSPAGRTVKVDITININGVTSVGYESTLLMKEWITKMPAVQKLIILFKYILAIRGFNSNFNGGIGSYCLFAMVAAYLRGHPASSDSDLATNFIAILKWYGEDFDNLSHVVWLREVGPCFVHQQQLGLGSDEGKKSLLRLMDPITQTMMNSSCNEYANIRAQFRRILHEFNNLESSIEDFLKECELSPIELSKIFQTKKGVEKLVTRFESRCAPSVKGIIDRAN